jgi:twinkle protein
VPTLYDVSGSADFRNQTHNGYTIYRHFYDEQLGIENETEFYNMKTKFNFQGEIGSSVKFKYCLENGRFYIGNEEPLNPLWEKEEDKPKQERKVLPLISAEDAFNGIDF